MSSPKLFVMAFYKALFCHFVIKIDKLLLLLSKRVLK